MDNTGVRTWTASAVLALVLLPAPSGHAAWTQSPATPAVASKEFTERTRAYMALHAQLALELPPLSTDATPEAIAEHRERLAAALREARKDAREGDIFPPTVAAQIRAIVRRDLKARDARDVAATLADDSYVLEVHVNTPWPPDLPRVTIPPRLLTSLYALPADLEYRFYDRHLVLLDVDAQLIVDVVRDAIPSSVRPRP